MGDPHLGTQPIAQGLQRHFVQVMEGAHLMQQGALKRLHHHASRQGAPVRVGRGQCHTQWHRQGIVQLNWRLQNHTVACISTHLPVSQVPNCRDVMMGGPDLLLVREQGVHTHPDGSTGRGSD